MTLTEIKKKCPAPEGMEWRASKERRFILVNASGTVRGSVDISRPDDDDPDAYVVVSGDGCHYQTFPTLPDLPAAYLRALAAVGLAPDPEKVALKAEVAELRRRLAWSEEVPTSEGLVLVWHPGDDEPEMWRTLETSVGLQWEHHNYIGRGNPFPPGTRFLPLANLKEPG